ncbi:hypothetical protein VL10_ORF64 [Staphylococcus phage vB_SauM_VL10]|nr:hypothetical protein VL10_ORF64 [Staphylococcus phage vB_SauM_VL10]
MVKHAEVTMISGKKYYLISDDSIEYTQREINGTIRGHGQASVRVRVSKDINSDTVFINPLFIESFKLVFEN